MLNEDPGVASEKFIQEHVHCCACGEPMTKSDFINWVMLSRIATWEYPSWGNVLTPGCRGLASAVLCDECTEEGSEAREAVEWDMSTGKVAYHPVEELARWTQHTLRGGETC